jgi:hypothetical protein
MWLRNKSKGLGMHMSMLSSMSWKITRLAMCVRGNGGVDNKANDS